MPRLGYTLVELLVPLLIIGLLLAVLSCSLPSEMVSQRQSACTHNQAQLTKALITYEATFNKYPGYTNDMKSKDSESRRVPWTITLLPFIDNNALYQDYVAGKPLDPAPEIAIFLCLSDPRGTRGRPTNNYIINAGRADGLELAANGVAHNRYGVPKIYTNSDYVRSGDGSANTLALSENLIATDWDAGYWAGIGPDPGPGKERQSMVWHADFSDPTRRINGNKATTTLDLNSARPSSFHPGGVVATFLDAHVVFLREDIDHKVYVQLLTTHHQMSTAPDKTYRLNSADYQ